MSEPLRDELGRIENETASSRLAMDQIKSAISEHYAAIRNLEALLDEEQNKVSKNNIRRRKIVSDIEAAQAREAAIAEMNARMSAFDVNLFVNEPWYQAYKEHQWVGAVKLAIAKRGLLGDGMGLGKTLTSIIWAQISGAKRILVVAPNGVVGNFTREVSKWSTLPAIGLRGKPKAVRNNILTTMQYLDKYVVTINYEAWRKDMALIENLKAVCFDTIIIDEAHNIKDTASIAYRGIEKLVLDYNACKNCGEHIPVGSCDKCGIRMAPLDRSIKNYLAMTGTPLLNKPTDMYPLLHLMNETAYPSSKNFERSYCTKEWINDVERLVFTPWGQEKLAQELGDAYVARNRHDAGIVLPTQEIIVHEIEFDEDTYLDQQNVIHTLNDSAAIILNGHEIPVFTQIAIYTRLRQANVWPGGMEFKFKNPETDEEILIKVSDEIKESIKIDQAINLIMEATLGGERVVLFSQFKSALIELDRRLHEIGINSVRYDGDTSQDIRREVEFDFDRGNNSDKYDAVLCHYKTGGVGLNFTAATQCIILDEEWNPGKRDQAYARLDRMGQTEETTVHVLRIPKTIDTYIMNLIEQKEQMVAGFNEARTKFDRKELL